MLRIVVKRLNILSCQMLLWTSSTFSLLQNDTVTVRSRKFMTNRLLQRKQMVRFQTALHLYACICVNNIISNFFLSCIHTFIACSLSVGRRCPASRQGHSPQDWNPGETRQDVQDHPWCCVRIWLQDSVWWRQDNRLRHGLRLLRLCKEEWTQTQTGQSEFCFEFYSQCLF